MARKEFSDIAAATTLVGSLSIGALSLAVASATGYPSGTYQFVIKVDDELILCDTRSGTTITVNSAGRGFSGTTAIGHANGAPVQHVWESNSATDLMRHVYDTSHDDHAQYQKESEKNQNNGYAGLDSTGVVPAARIDSAIARDTETTAAISAHAGAADPHGDRAAASAALTTHAGLTTAVHGIANTANLALTSDARFTDTRTPTDGTVTQAKMATGYVAGLAQSGLAAGTVQGQLGYDTVTKTLNVWSGTVWICITPVSTNVAANESTSLSTYTDITTLGPTVTMLTGTRALVIMSCEFNGIATAFSRAYAAVAVSGATTIAAADGNAVSFESPNAGGGARIGGHIYLTGLTPGTNTFKMQYRVAGGGASNFANRTMSVVGIPS